MKLPLFIAVKKNRKEKLSFRFFILSLILKSQYPTEALFFN